MSNNKDAAHVAAKAIWRRSQWPTSEKDLAAIIRQVLEAHGQTGKREGGDDSDQAFTEMPTHCTRFECVGTELVEDENRFMVCPTCQYSWGENSDAPTPQRDSETDIFTLEKRWVSLKRQMEDIEKQIHERLTALTPQPPSDDDTVEKVVKEIRTKWMADTLCSFDPKTSMTAGEIRQFISRNLAPLVGELKRRDELVALATIVVENDGKWQAALKEAKEANESLTKRVKELEGAKQTLIGIKEGHSGHEVMSRFDMIEAAHNTLKVLASAGRGGDGMESEK